MLSRSKDPSRRCEEEEGKDTVGWIDNTNIASVGAIVGRVGTLVETLGTVGWTDGPFLVALDELQRKSSKDSSTGWSDGLSEDTIGLSVDGEFPST
jgi:hypothetical protein